MAHSLCGCGATPGLATVSTKLAAKVVNWTSSVDAHADDVGCGNGRTPGVQGRVVQRRLVEADDIFSVI